MVPKRILLLLILIAIMLTACGPKELVPDEDGLVWKFETAGEIWSSPVFTDELVIFGSDDFNIYALDVYGGKLEWKYETDGMVRGNPVLSEGVVYVTSDDGFLYALESEKGRLLWHLDLHGTTSGGVREKYDYKLASPIIVGDVVYVGSADHRLYAVGAAEGNVLWSFESENKIRSTPAYADGLVYFGSWDGNVYALDASSGEKVWSYETSNFVQPSPLVVDEVVYVGSRFPYFFALDAATGEEIWRVNYRASWVESSAAHQDGVLFVGSSDISLLRAIDSQSGEVLWDAKVLGYPWADPVVEGDKVYIGNIYNYQVYMMAFDVSNGEMIWQFQTGDSLNYRFNGNYSSPVIYQDTVFFGSLDGFFYAIQP